jgi:hypothetical protein
MSRYRRDGLKFSDIVARDVEFLWSIQDYVYKTPWLDYRMSQIVSKQPWNDIGAMIWITSLVGCFELGVRHFWVVVTNLGASYLLNRMVRAKRPVEYDVRLQPTTDLHPDSFGFPSIESYMAVVVVGHIFKCTYSILFLLYGIPLVLVVGFSRIYSRSRLPHQIIASYMSGIVGLLFGIHYCERMGGGFHNMPKHSHGVWVGVVVVIFLANLALNMENNDSRLMYVSRDDFIRVIRGIMYAGSGTEQTGENIRGAVPHYDNNGEEDENYPFMDANSGGRDQQQPKSNAAAAFDEAFKKASDRHMEKQGLSGRKKRNLANRKDSFYFLQKQLQARAGVGGASSLASTPRNADSTALL